MSLWNRFFGKPFAEPARPTPRAATQSSGGGIIINTSEQLAEYLRSGSETASGARVTDESAMRQATVFGCVRIRSGVVKNLPLEIKRRVDDKVREDATNHQLYSIFKHKPNRWQTPSEFKQMLESHVQLRGNGYAMKVGLGGRILELIPMAASRVTVAQLDDLSLVYTYTRSDGRKITLPQSEVLHLRGLTLDGIVGVSPITYAREAIGLAQQTERHGAMLFKNGTLPGLVLEHPNALGPEGLEFLKASLEQYRGSENAHKSLILEEGMKANTSLGMTSEDAQFLDTRKFQRTDISMFWGVPPFMLGDTEKSTSWGSGLAEQKDGFLTFTIEDSLTMWEEAIKRDCITEKEPDIYARFNRSAFVRGNIQTRWETYVKARQWGVLNANEVRGLEDMNPREDEGGDEYAEPPNTAGGEGERPEDNPSPDPPAEDKGKGKRK